MDRDIAPQITDYLHDLCAEERRPTMLTSEEIAELERLKGRASSTPWLYDTIDKSIYIRPSPDEFDTVGGMSSISDRDYVIAIINAAPALLRAAEIAGRVPPRCCLTCGQYDKCEFLLNLPHINRTRIMCGVANKWEPIGGAE